MQKSRVRRALRAHGGFTLIELLLAVGLVVTLAAIAFPIYNKILEKARVTRAVGDISNMSKEVAIYRASHGCLPSSMVELGQPHLRDPWGREYTLAVASTAAGGSCGACGGVCVATGGARIDAAHVRLNADFDLYSVGRDGFSAASITSALSLDDVVRGRNGGFVGRASTY